MKLFPSLQKRYAKERFTAVQAQRLAQEIAFGPVVFQVSRLMLKFGIFRLLSDNREGLSLEQISQKTELSRYAAQVLLEASLTIGTVLVKDDQYILAKAGWFLLNDEMAQVNMNFNQDVNYKGTVSPGRSFAKWPPRRFERTGKLAYYLRRIIRLTRAGTEKLVRLRPFLFGQFFRPGTRNRIQPLSPDSARCRRQYR